MPASQQKLINFDITHIDAEKAHQTVEFQIAILANVAGHRGILHGRIKPLAPYMTAAGPAVTVGVRLEGNLAIHAITTVVKPGNVLVIDRESDLPCALSREIMATQAQASDIAGIIINSAVCGAETLGNQRFPAFAASLNPYGLTKFIPGRANHTISVSGATVQADDLVVGDIDGVVVIPHDEICTIIKPAKGKLAIESKHLVTIRDGNLHPH